MAFFSFIFYLSRFRKEGGGCVLYTGRIKNNMLCGNIKNNLYTAASLQKKSKTKMMAIMQVFL